MNSTDEKDGQLNDALDDVKRLHEEKMKLFERTIELERELAESERNRREENAALSHELAIWKVARPPREPTNDMLFAACRMMRQNTMYDGIVYAAKRYWQVMYDAAPSQAEQLPDDAEILRQASDMKHALELDGEAAKAYAAANPLGGPATTFEAIASRLRAGEPYAEVLDDYDLCHKQAEQPQPCCGEYATCERPCTPRGRWQAEQPPRMICPVGGEAHMDRSPHHHGERMTCGYCQRVLIEVPHPAEQPGARGGWTPEEAKRLLDFQHAHWTDDHAEAYNAIYYLVSKRAADPRHPWAEVEEAAHRATDGTTKE